MCFRGWVMSVPPACCTNSAGENVLPWQTQTMLTSEFEYLYRNPLTVLPFGPFPLVDTYGIWGREEGWVRGFGNGGFPNISSLLSFKVPLLEFSLERGLLIGIGSVFLFSALSSLSFNGSGLDWVRLTDCFSSCTLLPYCWDFTGGDESLSSGWFLASLELFNWVGSAKELAEWLWLSVLPPSEKTNVYCYKLSW